jgi:hypothetical protein
MSRYTIVQAIRDADVDRCAKCDGMASVEWVTRGLGHRWEVKCSNPACDNSKGAWVDKLRGKAVDKWNQAMVTKPETCGPLDDLERAEFLKALDKADVDVSDWEAKFIESNLGRSSFSVGQRSVIDSLANKYNEI